MKKVSRQLVAILLGLTASSRAATTLLTYGFGTDFGPSSNTADVTGSNFTASGMSTFNRFALVTGGNDSPAQGTGSGGVTVSTGTISSATSQIMNAANTSGVTSVNAAAVNGSGIPTSTTYVTFKATAASGMMLDLTSLSVDITKGGNGGPRGFQLFYSTDGFVSNAGLLGSYSKANNEGTDQLFSNASVDLSSIPDASEVTFRFNQFVPSGGNSLRYDNVLLNGDVVVPEPSTALLMGLAGSMLLLRRRKA